MSGRQLQKMLTRAGLTQREAAKALEIGERSMRRYVAAESVPKVIKLATQAICEEKTGL